MNYSTTSDPADGFSNHWLNAPATTCPECGSEEIEHDHFRDGQEFDVCLDCEEIFKID